MKRKYNDVMLTNMKIDKALNPYAPLVWLIAIATFCIGLYIGTSMMGSPLLYVPALALWGILLYFVAMIVRGRRIFLLVLCDSYAALAAIVYIFSLGAVGFLDTDDSIAYATIVGQFCFVILALFFVVVLRHIYKATSKIESGFTYRALIGLLWVIVCSIVLLSVSAIVFVPIYVMDSIDITIPFTLLGLLFMVIGVVSRKMFARIPALILFVVLGIASIAMLLQDPSQKQYLYVTASICILAFLSLAPGLSWRRVRKS